MLNLMTLPERVKRTSPTGSNSSDVFDLVVISSFVQIRKSISSRF